ncbi:dTDP-4-dehydrorhamnose reductase [Neisseria sp. HMSC70E02]|jgi:dTDP-4-dehydrorhamnose reductase|uniref:dTDP-4-dehydrorhamnose reductase n=1 Tax=Neisseria sp. HMSC70E02 TaxID=1608896 RepID=UPI0008A8EECF|nr:dTDP-4-dehydrorhamnose reductase [Neisseria sp. HMSC70E02]OHR73097.1 NAD(P)-dependent oxidoreductase [Neisseria sp. HMSC70E02]
MRTLLTGSKGQLARCFRDRLPENWELIATDSTSLDITDTEAVRNMVQNFQPDAIVNAAAFTAVDKAEAHVGTAFAVNATAVHNLASAARACQARFIHISTDYVFDGTNKTPYKEQDYTNPQSVYGRTKVSGELLALAANPDSVIIRTSWLFSEYGNNFVKTMIRLAGERDNLSIVHDQTGSPTYAGDLAQAIIALLQQPVAPRGIYHYGGNKSVTWYEFAQAIFQAAQQQDPHFKIPQLNAITTDQYPLPAPRPAYSIMDCQKIENECGIKASDWQKALNEIIGKLDN